MSEDALVLDYQPSFTCAQFHRSPALLRGIKGPIGSGKSVACCWELLRMAMAQEPHNGVRKTRWAIIRQTYPELISTTIKTWSDWFPRSICPIKFDAPITGVLELPLKDGTHLRMELIFLALEREDDAKKLLSLELTGAWVNEARELPWTIIESLMGRIGRYPSMREGGHTRKAVIMDTNPSDDSHWWYVKAEEEKPEGWMFFSQPPALIKTEIGYTANPRAENIKNLKDGFGYYLDQIPGKDPEWIKVYLLGEYGTIQSGKPVYGGDYSDSIHCSKVSFAVMPRWPVVLSFDFGLTPAAVFLQQTPRGQVRAVEEVITQDCDMRQLCRDIIVPKLNTRYASCSITVTGDPAGSTRSQNDKTTAYDVLHEELGKRVGDIVPCHTNVLSARIDGVKQLLGRLNGGAATFQISPECKFLRKGFMGAYKYRKIEVAGGAERYMEAPEKNMFSHVHDALQYGVLMILGASFGPRSTSISRQGIVAADQSAGL